MINIHFKLLLVILPVFAFAGNAEEFKSLYQSVNDSEHARCGFIPQVRMQQFIRNAGPDIKLMAKQAGFAQRPVRQDSALSPDGRFRMYFDRTGLHAVPDDDISGNGIPDYIDSAGVYLDETWEVEINQLGFYPPPGGDGEPVDVYPVYFTDFLIEYGVTYYGLTTPEQIVEYKGVTNNAFTSFMELHNDYESGAFYSRGLEGLKVTAAHEFHHSIQLGYESDFEENLFFMEMTSTWFEDYIYDEVNDYVNYLGSLFSYPYSTGFTSAAGLDPYANCLYVHMLEKQYGPEIVKNIWDRIIEENAFDAIGHELNTRSTSFAESQNQYAGWLYFTGLRAEPVLYFPEGADYPELIPNEGLDALNSGITGTGMRLVQIIPENSGLFRSSVRSSRLGRFSHILSGGEITTPRSFNMEDLLTFTEDEPVILVLTNPGETPITDLRYEVREADVVAGENPVAVRPGTDQMLFTNVPQNAAIRIFNILGQKIQTIYSRSGNSVQWNYRDSSNRFIPSGTYIYFVKSSAYEFAGKLTILR